MSKATRVKQIKQILGDSAEGGINDMFNEMMGVRDAELEIIRPKFVRTRNLARHIYKVLSQFSNFVPLRNDFPDMISAFDQIGQFASEIKESVCFKAQEIEETEDMYASVSKEDLNGLYKKLKENPIIKQLIVLCGKLKQYSKYFDDKDNLKDNFIGQEPGLSLIIFPFSTLDLKKLWANQRVSPAIKKYVLSVLHLLYKDLFLIYKITTSPDIDIDKFTKVLVDSIGQLRKQPGLNRCNNAFNRIEKSVSLLKNNFDDYYRESIASENPNMLVESFIVDVSNQGGADARLTREFREIIRYMHKVGAQNGRNKDPNVQKLFKMLNQNFAMMDKKSSTPVVPEESNNLDSMDFSLKSNLNSGTDGTDSGDNEGLGGGLNNIDETKEPPMQKLSKAQKRRDKKKSTGVSGKGSNLVDATIESLNDNDTNVDILDISDKEKLD
jgi:hypothetical protein